MEEAQEVGLQAACAGEEGGLSREDLFQDRMVRFLECLISNSTQTAKRTTKAISTERGLDPKAFEGLAMYALAKQWIRIEPVGNARVHSITGLGRRAYKELKSGALLTSL